MGKIVTVFNQKGGVGKTTTCVNLAAALGHKGKKTLLIDVDPQGNSTSGVGVNKSEVEYSTYDMLLGEATAREILIETEFKNLEWELDTTPLMNALCFIKAFRGVKK